MLRKTKLVCAVCLLLSAVMLFSSCYYNTVQYIPGTTTAGTTGESTDATTAGGEDPTDPAEDLCAPADAFCDYLLSSEFFRIDTKGEVLAGALKIRQGIDTVKLKSGKTYYYDSLATSFVEFHHYAFFEDGKVAVKENEEASAFSLDAYKAKYGTTPMDYAIEGILLNRSTVESLDVTENNDGTVNYHYVIKNVNSAAVNVRVQMKISGSLTELPDFKTMTIDLCVAADGTPITSDLRCTYTANPALLLGVATSCTQTLHSEYSFDPVVIPDAEEYRSILN